MLSDDLVQELGSLIRRLERKIRYDSFGQNINEGQPTHMTLDGIEQAIVGLVVLHIQLRRGQG